MKSDYSEIEIKQPKYFKDYGIPAVKFANKLMQFAFEHDIFLEYSYAIKRKDPYDELAPISFSLNGHTILKMMDLSSYYWEMEYVTPSPISNCKVNTGRFMYDVLDYSLAKELLESFLKQNSLVNKQSKVPHIIYDTDNFKKPERLGLSHLWR